MTRARKLKTYVRVLITFLIFSTSCKQDEDGEISRGPTAEALRNTFKVTGFVNEILRDVSIDPNGVMYVSSKTRIYKVSSDSIATVLAGSNTAGVVDGQGSAAKFHNIGLLSFDEFGNIYTIDSLYIRKITPSGNVSSIQVNEPYPLFFSLDPPFNNSVVVRNDHIYVPNPGAVINKLSNTSWWHFMGHINLTQGFSDGSGYDARFQFPKCLIWNTHEDNLVISDGGSLRKITLADSTVTTFAGGPDLGYKDGSLGNALFQVIGDFVIDRNGNYYLSDVGRIRKISPSGQVSTIAGPRKPNGKLFNAGGLAVDAEARYLYVADLDVEGSIIKIDLNKF